jgi:hypothetical protein
MILGARQGDWTQPRESNRTVDFGLLDCAATYYTAFKIQTITPEKNIVVEK